MESSYLYALLGGAMIGVAGGAFMILNGRIAGISGILGGLLVPRKHDTSWRVMFIAGLLAGGAILYAFYPSAFPAASQTKEAALIGAGLLVGFGTRLGSGCTSGHGVCGLARLSMRSLVATCVFIFAGAVTVYLFHHVGGGL